MKNTEIAEIFNNIADILEIKGDNPFRIRAYRKAAQNIENIVEDLEKVANKNLLLQISGVGKDLAEKITEYISTGKMAFYEKLKKEVPKPVLDLMEIPGIGPKTAKLLFEKFKIKGIDDLEKKARSGKIKGIFGIKEKTVENILRGIEFLRKSSSRTPIALALKISEVVIDILNRLPEVKRISPAGSLRRVKETVRDIDILVTSNNPKKVMDIFIKLPRVKNSPKNWA